MSSPVSRRRFCHALSGFGLALAGFPSRATAQRPNAIAIPQSEHIPAEAGAKLLALADRRRRLFIKSGFDDLVKQRVQVDQQLAVLNAQVSNAEKAFRAANQNASRLEGLAQGQAGQGLVAQAEAARQAAARVADEGNQYLAQRNEYLKTTVAPLMQRFSTVEREWGQIYNEMRVQIPRDRTDPRATYISETLDQITSQDPQMIEGYVLNAIASLFTEREHGDAERLLNEASDKRPAFLAPTSPVAIDFCYACCLAQRPKQADAVIKKIRALPAATRNAEHDWVVGVHGMFSQRFGDARKHLQLATTELKKQLDKQGRTPHPVVIADTVVMYMSLPNQQERGQKIYSMNTSVQSSGLWQALRAQAMILAEDENFGDAAAVMQACTARAPYPLHMVLGEQKDSYEAKKVWRVQS
jgi:hypothetical protein